MQIMWDVAAGILIAFMIAGGVIYGAVQKDRGILAGAAIIMAFVLIWRSSCWYWGLACDVPSGHEGPIPAPLSVLLPDRIPPPPPGFVVVGDH